MKLFRLVLAFLAGIALGGCDALGRPSEGEVSACVLPQMAEAEYLQRLGWPANIHTVVKVEFGKTFTSQAGMVEGAPPGTKTFPANVSFTRAAGYPQTMGSQVLHTANKEEFTQTFWVFKDSFGKVQCDMQRR